MVNLIGISGKINSGKDTVGKIIQSLVTNNYGVYKTQLDFINGGDWVRKKQSGWEIKKFAGKLKQIVSILTGIPVEDLEKQEVKDRVLGKEWWYVKILENKLTSNTTDFSKYNKEAIIKLTVRQLLQEVGTDAMRNVIHPNCWVNALFADYFKPCKNYQEGLRTKCMCYRKCDDTTLCEVEKPNWIITDMRFPNELQAVKDRSGITIRVNRPLYSYCGQIYDWYKLINVVLKDTSQKPTLSYANEKWLIKNEHSSETALDNAEFDYVIDNNGSLKDLVEKVKNICKDLKII